MRSVQGLERPPFVLRAQVITPLDAGGTRHIAATEPGSLIYGDRDDPDDVAILAKVKNAGTEAASRPRSWAMV